MSTVAAAIDLTLVYSAAKQTGAKLLSKKEKVDRKNGSRLFRRHSDSVRFALVAGGGWTLQKWGLAALNESCFLSCFSYLGRENHFLSQEI